MAEQKRGKKLVIPNYSRHFIILYPFCTPCRSRQSKFRATPLRGADNRMMKNTKKIGVDGKLFLALLARFTWPVRIESGRVSYGPRFGDVGGKLLTSYRKTGRFVSGQNKWSCESTAHENQLGGFAH